MTLRGLTVSFVLVVGSPLAAQAPTPPSRPPAQAARPEPTIICGTTVIPANPAVDPLFVKPARAGIFTMRTIQPSACISPGIVGLRPSLPYFFGPKR